jgi:hypothetical protein
MSSRFVYTDDDFDSLEFTHKVAKYAEGQPRDDHGRFASTDGVKEFDNKDYPRLYGDKLAEFRKRYQETHTGFSNVNGKDNITMPEYHALMNYIGINHMYINPAMRGEGYTFPPDSDKPQMIANSIRDLSGLIDRNPPLGENMELFRGVTPSLNDNFWERFQVGDKFTDPAFISTSYSLGTAERGGNTILRIYAPADTKGIDVEAMRSEDVTKINYYGENEVILKPNTTFEVISNKQVNYDNVSREIEVKVVKQ